MRPFDTVDHGIAFERLKRSFYVMGLPLSWLRSFLSGALRQRFGSTQSDRSIDSLALPSGPILGPLLLILNIDDLNLVLPSFGVLVHQVPHLDIWLHLSEKRLKSIWSIVVMSEAPAMS